MLREKPFKLQLTENTSKRLKYNISLYIFSDTRKHRFSIFPAHFDLVNNGFGFAAEE